MIRQGQIWLIDFNPTIGDEISKIRPALVVDMDFNHTLDLRTIVPITSWQEKFKNIVWMIKINNYKQVGLSKPSVINAQQIKSLSKKRFVKQLGVVDDEMLSLVHLEIIRLINFDFFNKIKHN